MPGSLIAKLICFIIAIVAVIVVVRRTRSYAARVFLALLLLPPAGFCVFGFAATFEPMDAVTQWTFRIGYVVVGVGLAGTSLMLLIRRPDSSADE